MIGRWRRVCVAVGFLPLLVITCLHTSSISRVHNYSASDMMHRVCYYAVPRNKSGDGTVKALSVKDIDPFLCTHVIVAFAFIRNGQITPGDPSDLQVYGDVIALKETNPNLKVLLSLGGGSTDAGFPTLVQDPHAVLQFAATAKRFLLWYGFDGLDLDWEFPAWPAKLTNRSEKRKFTFLVRQLYEIFKSVPTEPLLLTIAVAAPKAIIDRSYEVDELSKYIDFVSIMGYDYRIFWPYLPFTGYNAPLFKREIEKFYFATMNIRWSAEYWQKKGMPKHKLVIGIPTYGRTWKLLKSSWNGPGAPATGEGMLSGVVTFPDACIFVKEGARRWYDKEARVPYAVRGRDWVSYDDQQSTYEKVTWIKENDYAGVMTWNLNCDDWAGVCTGKKFALHSVIKEVAEGIF